MKGYVDFDGVILDTETHMFDDFERQYNLGLVSNNYEYIINLDWNSYLKQSVIIPGSLETLKELKKELAILTKVNSLDNEAVAKIKCLRDLGVENEIIIVPFTLSKSFIVNAKDNILVDDTIKNLREWENNGGIPLYFNKDANMIDPWNERNEKYPMIQTLERVKKYF